MTQALRDSAFRSQRNRHCHEGGCVEQCLHLHCDRVPCSSPNRTADLASAPATTGRSAGARGRPVAGSARVLRTRCFRSESIPAHLIRASVFDLPRRHARALGLLRFDLNRQRRRFATVQPRAGLPGCCDGWTLGLHSVLRRCPLEAGSCDSKFLEYVQPLSAHHRGHRSPCDRLHDAAGTPATGLSSWGRIEVRVTNRPATVAD